MNTNAGLAEQQYSDSLSLPKFDLVKLDSIKFDLFAW